MESPLTPSRISKRTERIRTPRASWNKHCRAFARSTVFERWTAQMCWMTGLAKLRMKCTSRAANKRNEQRADLVWVWVWVKVWGLSRAAWSRVFTVGETWNLKLETWFFNWIQLSTLTLPEKAYVYLSRIARCCLSKSSHNLTIIFNRFSVAYGAAIQCFDLSNYSIHEVPHLYEKSKSGSRIISLRSLVILVHTFDLAVLEKPFSDHLYSPATVVAADMKCFDYSRSVVQCAKAVCCVIKDAYGRRSFSSGFKLRSGDLLASLHCVAL